MPVIVHITRRQEWETARSAGAYCGDTLDTEGFIHCSTPTQVIAVANARFHAQPGLVLLCIDPEKVRPEIRYEGLPGGEHYPHIYGPLNTDAVVKVLDFPPAPDGTFALPPGVARML